MSKVNLADLIDEIDREDSHPTSSKSTLKKRLESISKHSKLVPYGTAAYKSLERQAAYKVASSEISSWQDTISSNRSSKQVDLTQPLPALPTLEQITTDLETSGFRAEVNQALGLKEDQVNQESAEEAGLRSKVRSDRFHEYQKQKRIAKIKSKLYHKIRNKRKDRTLMTHEEQAEEEDLRRIEERVSLRHSAAKLKKTLGRYAKDDGKVIISQNEALRQRIKNPSRVDSQGKVVYDSSSDEEFLAEQLGLEVNESAGLMNMKFMQDAQKRQREQNEFNASSLLNDLQSSKFKFDGDEKITKKLKKTEKEHQSTQKTLEKTGKVKKNTEKEQERAENDSELKNKESKVEKNIKESKKNVKGFSRTEEQLKIVEKAFELDEMDQIAAEEWARDLDEKKEKEPKMKKGWGSWFGSGIKQTQPTAVPVHRVDKVIHYEERDKRAAKFLVKNIPFPFKSSKQFDAVNKIPVGKEWNSKKVFLKQIAPDVLTRDGEIIQPISK